MDERDNHHPEPDFDALEDEVLDSDAGLSISAEDRDTGKRDEPRIDAGRLAVDDGGQNRRRRERTRTRCKAEPVPSSIVATDHSVVEWIPALG